VIGVATDVSFGLTGQPPLPAFYRPVLEADYANGISLLVRSAGPEIVATAAVRDAVRATAPSMPIASLSTMREMLAVPMWPRRTAAGFFLVCGALALLLATVGLFGVTYFTVRQRTREFGIRIALGARSSDVVRQILGEGVRLAVPGAALGLIAAFIVGRLVSRGLVGVSPSDPASFATTAAIEIAVALAACAMPARRATQADPMIALRDE
jgi:ABC-type antimicrobial peptide transport system permease subunit